MRSRGKEATITVLFTAGAIALVGWFAVHVVLLALWRPPAARSGVITPLTDESLLRVVRAVARSGPGERLRAEILAAAFSGAVRRGRLHLDDRGADGVWVQATGRTDEAALAPHELALLERIRTVGARAPGPVPLDALRVSADGQDRAWLARTTSDAVAWVRAAGLVRDRLPRPARALLRALLVVPVGLLTESVAQASGWHLTADLAAAVAVAAVAVLVWWGLGRVLLAPLRGVVLTEAGRVVLATAPPPPQEEVPAWVLSVLVTPAGQQPAWSSAGRSWRLVDVDAAGVRGGGERPGVALSGAFLSGVLLLVGAAFLGVVTATLLATHPQAWWCPLGLTAAWVGWLYGAVRAGRTAARATADLREGPERFAGRVVERRQVGHRDDLDRHYVVVDDGTGTLTTFLVTRDQFARAPEGGWVRIAVTPRLDHVTDVTLLRPDPPSSAVADLGLTLRRRRSRARSAGA